MTSLSIKYFTYVLLSEKDGRMYKGMTCDVEKRLKEHNAGYTKSTKGFAPWILFYKEEFNTMNEAREREKFLKTGVGREFFKKMVL